MQLPPPIYATLASPHLNKLSLGIVEYVFYKYSKTRCYFQALARPAYQSIARSSFKVVLYRHPLAMAWKFQGGAGAAVLWQQDVYTLHTVAQRKTALLSL
ncbi:hypothetical protein OUZ56_018312 [Daphnia magna]|uniref:Uncharacterized protein n=1 Tax=Daphnia magna TaxID=35525 RepID=A0ABQ9Z8J5_9CRUS|nr:hypothetical protein OUZ56_018312 [Daphnia magna]